jgi:hypothetical protein
MKRNMEGPQEGLFRVINKYIWKCSQHSLFTTTQGHRWSPFNQLTQLIAREHFIIQSRRESYKSYIHELG